MILVVNFIVYGSKIIQMNSYNFDKFGPFHTFVTINQLDIPLKVPHLLALGHNYYIPNITQKNKGHFVHTQW